MEERRRYVRVPADAQVSYRVIPDVRIKEHLTKDISQGGIRFLVHEPIPKGKSLKIRLVHPKHSFSFEALVKVAWVKELPSHDDWRYEVGVSFQDIPQSGLHALVAFIKTCMHVQE